MNTRRLAGLCACLVIMSGCLVPFLNPLYTEDTMVLNSVMLGEWQDDDDGAWVFKQTIGSKKYIIEYSQDGGKQAEFEAALVQIAGKRFLNTTVVDLPLEGDLTKVHLLPVFHIFRVEWNDGLLLRPFDAAWMTRMLEEENALSYVEIDDDFKIVTASTAELAAFVEAHLDTPNIYAQPIELTRKP